MDKLANMKAFVAVANTSSFVRAGQKLQLATSVVSKRVKDLEEHLGSLLLQRTTRQVSLTDVGYGYLEQAQRVLAELDELEESIRCQSQRAVGQIKIAAPLSFTVGKLGPIFSAFLKAYPEVKIKTFLSDKKIDLVAEGYDLAIRIGNLSDSSLISKRIASTRRLVCASPKYLAEHGAPAKPADLYQHECLIYSGVRDGKSWPFKVEGKTIYQPVEGRFDSDNGDLLCEAAIAGCGITMLPSFIIEKAINRGDLTTVLQDYEEPNFDVYVLYPNRRHMSNRIRLLIDFLEEHLKEKTNLVGM